MKCTWDDCFTCPYNECIKALKQENPETHKKYYRSHRSARLAYQKAYNESHKSDRHERSKQLWANMTEEQKEKERARQREAYRKKKEKEAR